MLDTLSFEKFCEFTKNHMKVAVHQEILGDQITPINAFLSLKDLMKGGILLESSAKDAQTGRHSFLGFTPSAIFQSKDGHSTFENGKEKTIYEEPPLTALNICRQQCHAQTDHPLRGFIGGLSGFISYNAIQLFEEISLKNKDIKFPDLFFKSYQDMIAFDHFSEKIIIFNVVEVKTTPAEAYEQALTRIKHIQQILLNGTTEKSFNPIKQTQETKPTITYDEIDINDEEYRNIVNQAKFYIKQGDIFQVVPSRCFKKSYKTKPINIYRALRILNPSPYMFYLDHDNYVITGASPEKLVSVFNRAIESCPLAGSAARGKDATQDEKIANKLLLNEKEVAEHMMLVDLARNDIGSVSEPGTVKVSELKKIKKFSTVMHISSTVQGKLRENLNALDALRATFPAGTLSGAPKIRAIEIIDELESTPRNLYGGGICTLDNQGNLDSCIAIRTAILKGGFATVRAGAGVVANSDPQLEADESKRKANSVLNAIDFAEKYFNE